MGRAPGPTQHCGRPSAVMPTAGLCPSAIPHPYWWHWEPKPLPEPRQEGGGGQRKGPEDQKSLY